MDILIRLYVRHDSDLINIHNNKKYSLASAMRDSVIAYVRKEPIRLAMPEPYLEKDSIKRNTSLHLYFHPEEDEDIIDFLLGVREGQRCAMIKNIVRGYLVYPNIYSSFENKEEALGHARTIYENTEQELTESGQEFVRGRGNRGARRTEEWEEESRKKKETKKIYVEEKQKTKPKEKADELANENMEEFVPETPDTEVMSEEESQELFATLGDLFC